MAAFILASIVKNYPGGQVNCKVKSSNFIVCQIPFKVCTKVQGTASQLAIYQLSLSGTEATDQRKLKLQLVDLNQLR